MAQSVRDIKRRIRSISSTMKITKAMELVSSSKLNKSKEKLESSRPYFYTILKDMQILANSLENYPHPLLQVRRARKILYIVISSDRGLAGGFNNNVCRLVEDDLEGREEKVEFVLVGTKAIEHFPSSKYHIKKQFEGITENPTVEHAKEIAEYAMNLYVQNQVDRIEIFFTQFVNNITQEQRSMQVMPIQLLSDEDIKPVVMDFEPSIDEFLEYLIKKYVESSIYGALMESSCSQQGARMTAMEVASDNAEEMIEELSIKYNRARQSAITTEITEIIAGVQALK